MTTKKYLIRNGRIHTGERFIEATDILIEGNRIGDIGYFPDLDADEILDVNGSVVCPGFIDVQNMHDRLPELNENEGFNLVTQGVTSCIVGNCGRFGDRKAGDWFYTSDNWFIDQVQLASDLKLGVNVGVLLGHNTLRDYVLSKDGKQASRPASPAEIKEMGAILRSGLECGALGLSTGLMYFPSTFADHMELTALASIVGEYGKVYTTHMKDEGPQLIETISESMETIENTGAALVISHFKVTGKRFWGKSIEAINLIEKKRANQPVFLNFYPYTATSTTLDIILLDNVRKRYGNPADLQYTIEDDKQTEMEGKQNLCLNGWKDIVVVSSQIDTTVNRSIADIAQDESCYKTVVKILQADPRTRVTFHNIASEDDYHNIVKLPYVMPGTDGYIWTVNSKQATHPRNYGAFSRLVERYVFAQGLISLEELICQSTSVPAKAYNLSQRGLLQKGFFADIIIFEPQKAKEIATYEEPYLPSEGMQYVFINGNVVLNNGKPTNTYPGAIL